MLSVILVYAASLGTKAWIMTLGLAALSWSFCQTIFQDAISQYADDPSVLGFYIFYPLIILMFCVLPALRQKRQERPYVVPTPAPAWDTFQQFADA